MKEEAIREMLLEVLKAADYDLGKSFEDPEYPDCAEADMARMIEIVREHLEPSHQTALQECSWAAAADELFLDR